MRLRARTPLTASLLACVLVGASVGNAAAQSGGVRAGISGSPDQFYFGGHVEFGPVADRLWFRPNLEIGVGDSVTLAAFNIEFAYRIPVRRRSWQPYVGGGPALNLYRRRGETNPEGGFNILLGAQHRGGLFAETKVGLVDSPSFKVGIGYAFRP